VIDCRTTMARFRRGADGNLHPVQITR
jgi:hypothetical protein